jgi:hypothetical protein
LNAVCSFLVRSYWENQRPKELIRKAIENSLCYGMYEQERLVGLRSSLPDQEIG